MTIIIYLIIGIIFVFFIIAWMLWRFYSRRASFPCPHWLSWLIEHENPLTKANQAKVIIGNLNLQPGMKVLDVGCGPGRLTIPIAKKIGPGGQVVALDIQEKMLKRVHKKAEAENLDNIIYLNTSIGTGVLGKNQFDRALLVTVLGEIPDTEKEEAFKEIFDALKPHGILSITETVFDPHFQRMKSVKQLAQAARFRKKESIGNRFAFTMQFEKSI